MQKQITVTLWAMIDAQTGWVSYTCWNEFPSHIDGMRAVECEDYVTADFDHDPVKGFVLMRDEHPSSDTEPKEIAAERAKIRAATAARPAPRK